MKVQKTNEYTLSTLYLVPTPIGNFEDMTFRSIEVLKNVDYIYCEDTRVTKILLSHFNIKTPLRAYHKFNEEEKTKEIITLLEEEKNIALVSDAGLPCISDPGYLVVKEASKKFNITSLPGANAGLTALIASSLPCDKFYFYGFLNSKESQRIKELERLRDFEQTIIFYEAPHRIKKTLENIYQVFGNRQITIARELTKKYEEYIRGNLEEIVASSLQLKGEIVLIVDGSKVTQEIANLLELSIREHYNYYFQQIHDEKVAIKKVANDRDVAKNIIYKEIKGGQK